jgi:hypothetical protein
LAVSAAGSAVIVVMTSVASRPEADAARPAALAGWVEERSVPASDRIGSVPDQVAAERFAAPTLEDPQLAADQQRDRERIWQARYAQLTAAYLASRAAKLDSLVQQRARQIARERIARGEGFVVPERELDLQEPRVRGLLCPFSIDDEGVVSRYTLSRAVHRELYALDDEAAWLRAEIARRSAAP